MSPAFSGHCLCQQIHYSADTPPVFMGNCHCRDCQRSSGSGFIPAMIFPETAVKVTGSVQYFSSQADDGSTHQRGFCPTCGSQLFSRFSNLPGMIGTKAGTLNQPSDFVPQMDFYVASAAPWDAMNSALPKKPGAARGE
ncbi:GFA family protein [Halothiobacillus sp. DCM-1]|uniref:GFA family protein n=1 Tax=Halothiobacillus sp. DCM-1 TaxID=3112558 RepID=UPI00324694C1